MSTSPGQARSFADRIREAAASQALERLPDSNERLYDLERSVFHQSEYIIELEKKISDLKTQVDRLDRRYRRNRGAEIVFLTLPLIFATGFIGFLVAKRWAEISDVSIDFNFWEMIGGLLVGLGGLAAGVACAMRHPDRRST